MRLIFRALAFGAATASGAAALMAPAVPAAAAMPVFDTTSGKIRIYSDCGTAVEDPSPFVSQIDLVIAGSAVEVISAGSAVQRIITLPTNEVVSSTLTS